MRSYSLYRIPGYVIDLATRAIHRGDCVVDVEAKVFDLIALLLVHRDRALSKREINDAIWGTRPVTEAALSQLLSKARRALGDDGDRQCVIRTVHGRGLQWAAAIEVDDADQQAPAPTAPSPTSPKFRWLWWVGFVVAVAVVVALFVSRTPPSAVDSNPLPRIAVLPIIDRTGEEELGWTRDGLMGLISSLLQEGGHVEVVSAPIAKTDTADSEALDVNALDRLRQSLGATHLLRGELRRIGSLYELELQLSSAGSTQRRDILRGASPTPLAVDAVPRVQHWLGIALPSSVPEENTDIRSPFLAEAYARGLDASAHGDEQGAAKYYQICLDQDPGLLWPRLRLARSQGSTNQLDTSIENATRVADTARNNGQDDLLVQALRQLAGTAYYKGDGDTAARYLDEALSKMPDEHRPLSLAGTLATYGAVEIKRGHLDQARNYLQRALRLTHVAGSRRNESIVMVNLAIIEVQRGDPGGSIAHFREAIDVARQSGAKDIEMRALGGLGAAEFDAGHALTAVPMLTQALVLAQELADQQTIVHVATNLARVLATFGQFESADALIEQAQAIGAEQKNTAWMAKAAWARGVVAEQRGAWTQALAALHEAHQLFALTRSTADDVAVLADTARVAVRAANAEAGKQAAAMLASVVDADSGSPELRELQPLVDIQTKYLSGDRLTAVTTLQALVDTKASLPASAAKFDTLLQLARWRSQQQEHAAVLDLMDSMSAWIEQYPDVILLHVAALRGVGKLAEADAEQARLDHLTASRDLTIDHSVLSPPKLQVGGLAQGAGRNVR